MTREEFIENVNNLFNEYNIYHRWDDYPHDFYLNDDSIIAFNTSRFEVWSIEKHRSTSIAPIYESLPYDDFEKFYDEILIFKELILPKYL